MYIKQVVIDGFKSYATRTTINGFDPLFNAITGLNGSGKSNILDSICFLLGISNLTQVTNTFCFTKDNSILCPWQWAEYFFRRVKGRMGKRSNWRQKCFQISYWFWTQLCSKQIRTAVQKKTSTPLYEDEVYKYYSEMVLWRHVGFSSFKKWEDFVQVNEVRV